MIALNVIENGVVSAAASAWLSQTTRKYPWRFWSIHPEALLRMRFILHALQC